MSWDVVKLGDVISHRKGFITIDDEKPYKLCRVQLHRRGVLLREIIKGNQIKTKKQQICKNGDFLVAEMDAKVGGYGFIPPELEGAIVSSHYYLFELNTAKIKPKYLEVLSKLLIIQDQIKATGSTNYAAIRPQNVLDWEIPLPDIQTQERIADLYVKTSTGCDYLKSNYLLQLDLLKKLRQQILQDAVQGKLVPQDHNDEPASKLLGRIKMEKEKLVREKKIKKEKPLPPIKPDEIPFEIPDYWVWCRLGDISSNITKGSSPTWQGIRYVDSEEDGILFLTSKNVGNYNLIFDELTYVEREFNNIEPRSILKKNDLLTNIVGGSIGRTAIYNLDKTANINQAVCLIRFETAGINLSYLLHLMNSDLIINLMFKNQFAPGRANLSMSNIAAFPIPFPPINEQYRIVTKIEQLMTICDELEQAVLQNQKYTQELLQVALKEALEPKIN